MSVSFFLSLIFLFMKNKTNEYFVVAFESKYVLSGEKFLRDHSSVVSKQ